MTARVSKRFKGACQVEGLNGHFYIDKARYDAATNTFNVPYVFFRQVWREGVWGFTEEKIQKIKKELA